MLLKQIFVCQITDICAFAEEQGIAYWNEIINLIYEPHNSSNPHRHFLFYDAFVVTENFFNRKYQDDAYGLFWHAKVRKVIKAFMKHHKIKEMLILTSKNCNTTIL